MEGSDFARSLGQIMGALFFLFLVVLLVGSLVRRSRKKGAGALYDHRRSPLPEKAEGAAKPSGKLGGREMNKSEREDGSTSS